MTANTVKRESKEKETQLLTSEEQAVLSQVAAKEPPHSQRAQALLAINEGATQAEAGQQSGLTRNQVRYWLTKFRASRTAIFPDALLIQALQVQTESPQSSAEQAVSPIVLDPGQPEDEEEVAQELPDEEETAGPIDLAPAEQEETPKVKKKKAKKSVKTKEPKKASKTKKSKKKTKKDKKASKAKKPKKKAKKDKKASKAKKSKKKAKKDKKASKAKKSKKKAKKGKAQKTKGKKGKSSKKKRK